MFIAKGISVRNEIINSIIAIIFSVIIAYIIHLIVPLPFTRAKLIIAITIPTVIVPFFIIPAYFQKKKVFQAKQELKTSLDEKTELVMEVQHRVKNNLSIILSLLHLQQQTLLCKNDYKSCMQHFERRVQTISLSHDHILNSPDHSSLDLIHFIEDLKDQIILFIDNPYRQIQYNLNPGIVKIKLANVVSIGLILGELFLNSLQHAFEGRNEGNIRLQVKESNNSTILTFEDDGIGIPENSITNHLDSIGLTLISVLAGQIKGKFDIKKNNGTIFTLTFKN